MNILERDVEVMASPGWCAECNYPLVRGDVVYLVPFEDVYTATVCSFCVEERT